jgi:hypothetical protein
MVYLFQFWILFQVILASQRDYQIFMKNSGGFDPIPNMTLGILPNSPDCTLLCSSAGPMSHSKIFIFFARLCSENFQKICPFSFEGL